MPRASDGKREPTHAPGRLAIRAAPAEPRSEPRRQWNFCSPSPSSSKQTSEGESSTDIPDSAVEIPDCHDWLDEDVRAHSSQATGTRQASVPAVKVVPNGRGDPPDVGKDSGKRRHSEGRHRHKSPALCSPTGNHSGASGDDTGGEVPNRHRSRTSDPRDAYSGRRRHSEGGEGAHGKRVNDRRDVSFGPASDPDSLSSRPPRRQQTDEASLVVRSAPLLIENNKVVLVRAQLAEHGIAGVDDAAIAKELEAQGGHVGRTVNRLKNRPVALPAAISSRRSASEQTAAEIAANVARTAAVAGGAQQRRHDEAALRYYTKAFKAEHGRSPSSEEDWLPMARTRARLDGTGENTPEAATSISEESGKKAGRFLQTSAMQFGRSFDHEDLLAEPLEALDELEKDMDEKLRQVRSAKNAKHVADRLQELSSLSASMRFLPVANSPSASGRPSEQGSPSRGNSRASSRVNSGGDAEATDELDSAGAPSFYSQTTNAAGSPKTATEEQSLRLRLRGALLSPRCEIATLLMILVYGLLVLFDLGVEGLALDDWNGLHLWIDALFLFVFMIEIILRLYAFGPSYCGNILNLADSFAITFSFVVTLLDVAGINLGGDAPDAEDAEDEDGEGSGMLKKLSIFLRFLRIGRLVTVMMRTMRTLERMADDGGHDLDVNGNAVADDPTFTGCYRKAAQAFSWSPKDQDDLISVPRDKLVALVMDSPSIVRVLTDDFSTLLECVCKMDKNKDGKIVFEELKPLLVRVFNGEEEVSAMKALFDVLDLNQDGYITAVELYAARLGLRKLIEQEAGREADPGDQSINGQSIDGDKGKKKHSLCEKGASGRLKRAIRAKWRWVSYERWQNDGTLVELRRTRDAKGDGEYSEASALLWETLSTHLSADTYEFQPGAVDIPTYIDGSGALLEYRVDQIVRSVADCTREVAELSQKLQEIEVAQPVDAAAHRISLTTYSTYLKGLSVALPSACLRMQPYANYETDVGVSWHALRPREGVDQRVRVGALGLSIGMILAAALNVMYLLLVYSTGTGGFTHMELRQACEETWVPGFTMDAVIDGTAVVKDATAVEHVMKLGTCEQADGPLRAFSLSLLFPAVGCLTLCMAPLLFMQNAEATALVRLLTEPKTLILILQAVGKAGLDTITLTKFPAAVRLYSIPSTGAAMLAGRLTYCLLVPVSVILFILLDVCVVTAPRMRSVFGISILVLMLCELYTFTLKLPTVVEPRGDFTFELARNFDFALLAMFAGAIAATFFHPNDMAFVHLPTDLPELVLFDTGRRRQRAAQHASMMKYRKHANKLQSMMRRKKAGVAGVAKTGGKKLARGATVATKNSASMLHQAMQKLPEKSSHAKVTSAE